MAGSTKPGFYDLLLKTTAEPSPKNYIGYKRIKEFVSVISMDTVLLWGKTFEYRCKIKSFFLKIKPQ